MAKVLFKNEKKKKQGEKIEREERKRIRKGEGDKLMLDTYTAAFNSWITLHGNPPQRQPNRLLLYLHE